MTDLTPAQVEDVDPDVCPGPCNRAWEAAEKNAYVNGEPHNILPVAGQPIWCPDCRHNINERLLELPDLVNHLAHGLHTPPADTGRITRSQANPSPSPTFDLADEACRWAVDTEIALRQHLTHPQPAKSTMRRAVAYLTGHLTALLNQDPDGIDFGMSVNRWHTRLTHATGGGPATYYRIPAECPACHRRGQLKRKEGDDLVKCGGCTAVWDYEHWQMLVRAAVSA